MKIKFRELNQTISGLSFLLYCSTEQNIDSTGYKKSDTNDKREHLKRQLLHKLTESNE